MKNNQKTLSWKAQFAASVALRTLITNHWKNRRNAQKLPSYSDSVSYWSKELRTNIAAYREIQSI